MRYSGYSLGTILAFIITVRAQTPGFDPIIKPTQGQDIHAGQNFEIVWNHSGASDDATISIKLLQGQTINTLQNGPIIASNIPSKTGRFTWSVPRSLQDNDVYTLVVTLDGSPDVFQRSSPFDIYKLDNDSDDIPLPSQQPTNPSPENAVPASVPLDNALPASAPPANDPPSNAPHTNETPAKTKNPINAPQNAGTDTFDDDKDRLGNKKFEVDRDDSDNIRPPPVNSKSNSNFGSAHNTKNLSDDIGDNNDNRPEIAGPAPHGAETASDSIQIPDTYDGDRKIGSKGSGTKTMGDSYQIDDSFPFDSLPDQSRESKESKESKESNISFDRPQYVVQSSNDISGLPSSSSGSTSFMINSFTLASGFLFLISTF